MKDIIERLEKATGPDRDIDAAIQRATDGNILHIGCGGLTNAFTASVDAALMLIPENWRVGWCGQVPSDNWAPTNDWFFELHQRDANEATDRVWAKTAALAICIVALKARALSTSNQTEPDRG